MEKNFVFVFLFCLLSTPFTLGHSHGSHSNNETDFLESCFVGSIDKMTKKILLQSDSEETNGINMSEGDQNGKSEFTLELFHQLYNEDDETNLFFSPHSVHEALTLALFGAKGETENQLRGLLRLNDSEVSKSDIYRRFKAGHRILRNSSTLNSVQFNIANRLFFSDEEPIRPCIRSIFGGDDDGEKEMEFVDFTKAEEAARKINKWVEAETKGKIKDLIPPADLSPQSRIALANSAYFKGQWQQEFDKNMTKLSLFHISPDKITMAMMMYLKGNFQHGASESLKSYILDMPYKGNSHSMIILLPPFLPDALNETISRLNAHTLRQSIDDLRNSRNSEFSFNDEVEIYLPRFKIEQTFELTKVLKSLGVSDLFNPDAADLTEFSEKSGLSFNTAIHKSFLEVNEEGSEAAAATAFISARRGRLHPLTRYVVNRPFIFFIVDNTNRNDILFTGVFKTPKVTKKSQ